MSKNHSSVAALALKEKIVYRAQEEKFHGKELCLIPQIRATRSAGDWAALPSPGTLICPHTC